MPDGIKTFKCAEGARVSRVRSWGLFWVDQALTAGFPLSKWNRCFWHTRLPAGGFQGVTDWLVGWLRSAESLTDGLHLRHTEVCDGSSSPNRKCSKCQTTRDIPHAWIQTPSVCCLSACCGIHEKGQLRCLLVEYFIKIFPSNIFTPLPVVLGLMNQCLRLT